FNQLFNDAVTSKQYATLRLLYDRREQDDKVTRTVDNAIQLLRSLVIGNKDKQSYWFEVYIALLKCGTAFKAPEFSREKEWRVWMLRPDRNSASTRPAANGEDIYYERLPLKEEVVCSIVLGPLFEGIEGDVLDLAKRNTFMNLSVTR